MSIQTNFPAIKPTLLLDFANTKQLDSRITFTRASTATYYGTQTAKAEENLLTYSQEFDNAAWTKSRLTVTANDTTAPDNTTTAEKIQQNAGQTLAGACQQSATSVSGSSYVISVFAKAGTNRNFLIIQDTLFSASGSEVWFDILNGTVGTIERPASHTASIVSAGNGWFRCIVQFTAGVSNAGVVAFYAAQTDNTTTVTDNQGFIYIWGAQLELRSAVTAYTPTTTQAITNYVPQILTAASGVARFDHNPTTFESLGLEIEESRTNLVTYSSEFDNAAWTKSDSTITANTIVAPDGTVNADSISETTATGNHRARTASISVSASTSYTCTVFAKLGFGSVRYLGIGLSSTTDITTGSRRSYVFDLSNGTATTTGGATWTVVSGSATAVGNGWYRCQMTVTTDAAASTMFVSIGLSDTFSAATFSSGYTGDGYSGLYIWGAQLEAGAFATSYIPTVASQVTRAADAPSMTGTNFSSWFNQSEGTLYAEGVSVDSISGTTARRFAEVNNNSTDNLMSIEFRNTNTSRFTVTVSNVSEASISSGGTINQFSKIAGAYKINDFNFCTNGTLGTQDTSGIIPVVTQLSIGNRSSNINAACINGTLKKIAYYPMRVTNAQLQGLTS